MKRNDERQVRRQEHGRAQTHCAAEPVRPPGGQAHWRGLGVDAADTGDTVRLAGKPRRPPSPAGLGHAELNAGLRQ